jgi:hypothetical protein
MDLDNSTRVARWISLVCCHASDMDYRAVVVADGCSDKDPEVPRVLMEKIFPFQARVATVEEVIGALP